MSKIINQPEPVWVPKPWGGEKWLDNRPEYCGKILTIIKNKRLSVHYHKLKTETFYCLSGKVKVKFFDDALAYESLIKTEGWDVNTPQGKTEAVNALETIVLEPDSTFFIPPGRVHQIIGLVDSKIIEVSTEHFDSDSFRFIKGD